MYSLIHCLSYSASIFQDLLSIILHIVVTNIKDWGGVCYCIVFISSMLQFFFFFLNTHPLLYSLLNGFCPHHLSEIFLYRSIRPHFGQYQQSLFNYLFVINTAACSIKIFFFFHWLPVHSDFSSVLLFSFTDLLSLPIFKHLGVSGYHSFWCFLLKQVSVVGLRSIYQNHLDDFFKL